MPDGQNYALNFLTKKALLGQDIDFRQSLSKGYRARGIRIRCQLLAIMHLIFSLTRGYSQVIPTVRVHLLLIARGDDAYIVSMRVRAHAALVEI